MTKAKLAKFRKTLEMKKAELLESLGRHSGLEVLVSPEESERAQFSSTQDLAVRNRDRENELLLTVMAALRRVEEGTYGTCTKCEDEIPLKRLQAIPWTPLCIDCKEIAERRGPRRAGVLAATA